MGLHSIRRILRLLRLVWVIVSGMIVLGWFLHRGQSGEIEARISWMQWMSRRFLSLLHCQVMVMGEIPKHGLIACNHLGYVDILVLGSICPAIFVAKSDVNHWPVFGWLCRNAGTIFVSRNEAVKVPAQLRAMEQPLRDGRSVILFPEGTSSDGSRVLPFRSSLLESAIVAASPVTPVAITYDLHGEGSVGEEIAYWGDAVLMNHLLNLLSKGAFVAKLNFGPSRAPERDRKSEALLLHRQVSDLLESCREFNA